MSPGLRGGQSGREARSPHRDRASTGGGFFVYAIVLLVPVSCIVAILRGDTTMMTSKIPLADAAICAALVTLLVEMIRKRTIDPLTVCTAPLVAFGAVSVISMLNAGIEFNSAKELMQMLVQFIGGYIVIAGGIRTEGRLRMVVTLVTLTAAAVIAYALVQYTLVGDERHLVSSVFDNRNVLGGYIALVVPVLFGLVLWGASAGKRVLYGAVIAAGLLAVTSITSFFSILVSFMLMCFFRRKAGMLLGPVAAVFVAVIALPLGVRIGDLTNLKRSFHEPRELSQYHDRLEKTAEMLYYNVVASTRRGHHHIILGSSMIPVRAVPYTFIRERLDMRKKDESFGEGGHLHQRVLEWQAGINVLRDKPLFGVGVGNYQSRIGHYYFYAPKLNTMEPDSQCGYIVTLFTTGLAGLAAFVWIVAHAVRRAAGNVRRAQSPFMKGLSGGTMGSMIAFSINNMFSPLVYQSTVVQFIIILGMIGAMRYLLPGTREGAPPGDV